MKLLIIVLCLLSERYLLHSLANQRFVWFPNYAKHVVSVCNSYGALSHPLILVAGLVLPIFLLTTIFYLAVGGLLFGFVGFLISLAVLYYCFGSHNIFYPIVDVSNKPANEQVALYLSDINTQAFALIFWFLVAGPMAALFYRLISLCRNISQTASIANMITDVLEWLPARILMLFFLFTGNFQKGYSYFYRNVLASPDRNAEVIGECGLLAMTSTEGDVVDLPVAERFMEYTLIVFLSFIAVLTLIAWI